MRPSVVKAKLRRNEPVLVTCLHLTDATVYELASRMGFDCLWMDLEHHGYSVETAAALMRAARTGRSDCMARPGKGEFMRMGRLLEMGAHGIMYPRCSGPEEAAEVVRWAKFAPLGERGFDGGNPDMPYCTMDFSEYVEMANRETWIVVQLEDQKAVDQAEAIAAVPGVDVVLLGQADFSVLSGFPGDFAHPRIQKALEKTATAARNTGKHWGTPCATAERARQMMDLGARFICSGTDIRYIKNGLEAVQKNFASLGFQFRNEFLPPAVTEQYVSPVSSDGSVLASVR